MRNDRSSIGTGILLIAVGLLFMADRQGYMDFRNLWPLLILIAGVVTLLFPKETVRVGMVAGHRGVRYRSSNAGSGIWLIFVGLLLFANQNHWMSFRDSWPLFIVAGGLSMIFGARRRVVTDSGTQDPNSAAAGSTQEGGQWR